MSDNKELFDDELRFDEEIDFDGLDEYDEEETIEDDEEFDDNKTESINDNYEQNDEQIAENVDYSYDIPDDEIEEDENDYSVDELETEKKALPEPKELQDGEIFFNEHIIPPAIEYKQPEKNDEQQKNKNISINKLCIVNTAVSAVTLCAVAAGIVFGYGYINSIEKDLEIKNAEIKRP